MGVKCIKPRVAMLSQSRGELATVATQRINGRARVAIRKQIAERDGYRCQICGRLTIKGEVDHVVPLHLGGSDTDDNKQWLHVSCHAEKSKGEGNARGGL